MAKPRKLKVVRYYDADGKECRKGTPGAVQKVCETEVYYGAVPRPGGGRAQMVPLCGDFAEARRMLERLRGNAQAEKYNLHDPFAEHLARPVAEHAVDYEAHIVQNGSGVEHAERTRNLILSVFDAIGVRTLADVDPDEVTAELARRRQDEAPVRVEPRPGGYRMADLVEMLGISITAVGKAIRLHGLAASGNGKARRYPAETVQALLDRQRQGVCGSTVNHHIRALRAFGRWLLEARRWEVNRLHALRLLKTSDDGRHRRRALSAAEVRALLDAAAASPRSFRGLTGPDRRALYLCAALTALRARALAGLCPEHFWQQDGLAFIALPASLDKAKKRRRCYLAGAAAAELMDYLAGKPKGSPVWGACWRGAAAEMVRGDLPAAGIPYVVETPDGPGYADFHALRHTTGSIAESLGIAARTIRRMTGHAGGDVHEGYIHTEAVALQAAAERVYAAIIGAGPAPSQG